MSGSQRELIAARIKGLREASELTPAAVAQATDISVEQYTQYETGERDVPMSYLPILAAFYKMEVTPLLTGGDAHAKVFHVTRKGTGATIARRNMYNYEALGAGFAGKALDAFIVTVEPSLKQLHLNTHQGQEFNYVLAGTLQIMIGNNKMVLEAGDSIHFKATEPHGMLALGGQPAKFLAIITL